VKLNLYDLKVRRMHWQCVLLGGQDGSFYSISVYSPYLNYNDMNDIGN